MTTDCSKCKFFKQETLITFTTPGKCGWQSKEVLPEWMKNTLEYDDYYYGFVKYGKIRKDIETQTYQASGNYTKNCPTFKKVSGKVYRQRYSENWYEFK